MITACIPRVTRVTSELTEEWGILTLFGGNTTEYQGMRGNGTNFWKNDGIDELVLLEISFVETILGTEDDFSRRKKDLLISTISYREHKYTDSR